MDSRSKNYIFRLKAIPKPFTVRCEIEQFPFRMMDIDDGFDSPNFEVGVDGVPLQLLLRHRKNASVGEVLNLFLCQRSKKKIKLDFSITLVNSQPEKSVKKQKSECQFVDGDSWYSWDFSIPYAKVIDKDGGFLKHGHQLTVLVEGVAFDWKQGENILLPMDQTLDNETTEDFGKLLDEGTLSDFVVKVKDADGQQREFKVHKLILLRRSEFFAAMFSQPDVKECREGQMEIEDIRFEVMEALIRFLYTGKIPTQSALEGEEGNFGKELELLVAADKYGVLSLKNLLERVLASKLSVENVCGCFVIAERHSTPFLAARCREFIRGRAGEVIETDGWSQLCTPENAKLMGSFLFAGDTVVKINGNDNK